jgi:superfamily II DNA or RNA helicase
MRRRTVGYYGGLDSQPYRSDEWSMLELLPVCACARSIPEMVQEGWLASLTWQPVQEERVGLSSRRKPMNTELYPYQRKALSPLQQRLEDGWQRLYIELPTGTGKSTSATAFAEQRQALGRILAPVHRQDLAQQLANTFRWEGLEVGLHQEGERTLHSLVVVATVQSLTPEATQELVAPAR